MYHKFHNNAIKSNVIHEQTINIEIKFQKADNTSNLTYKPDPRKVNKREIKRKRLALHMFRK